MRNPQTRDELADRETDLIGSESSQRETGIMAKQATQPQPSTRTIAENQWIPFLADFTRENRGGHARLEVLGTTRNVT
jgi:hypothetical protein